MFNFSFLLEFVVETCQTGEEMNDYMFSSMLSIICFDIALCPFCFLTHQAACLIISPCLYASMKRKLRLQKRRGISVVPAFKAKGTHLWLSF